MRKLLVLAAVFVALPATASAGVRGPASDVVVAEVSAPMDVAIDGPVVAYTQRIGKAGAEVVVVDRAGTRRIPAGRGSSPVAVGRGPGGRRWVAYQRCTPRCALVARPVAAGGRSKVIAGGTRPNDLAVGGGRVFWIEGRRVRSRALRGGAIRREAYAGIDTPDRLDADARTLAVTGDTDGDEDSGIEGGSALSVSRPGSGRARVRAARSYSQEPVAYRSPVITKAGITTLFEDGFAFDTARKFADFPAGRRGVSTRGSGGMEIVEWDASGDAAVFLEAPTDVGCGIGSQFQDTTIAAAPCRIVRADLGGERLLPPAITVASATATVRQVRMRRGRVTGATPLPGVPVEIRDGDGKLLRVVATDARGTIDHSAFDSALALIARTTPRSYGFVGGT